MRKRLIHKNNYKIYHRPYSELNVLEKKRVAEACFRKITVCALFLVIGICFLALYRILFLPRIFLEGSRVMKIEYQGQYIEPGFLSSYQGMDLSSKVKVSGEVDTSEVGSYPITYEVSYQGHFVSKTRIVKVVDSKKPKIKFLSNPDTLYICPNTKYLFDDYVAVDDYDGDITKEVKVKQSGDIVKYVVSDSSGNKVVKERKIYYKDIEKPTLELDSANVISLTVGDDFTDSMYQVSDNCDDNIKVKVSGEVDTSKVGSYVRNYVATDSSGNKTKIVQKVMVFEPTKKGVIYLTFDDGPRSGTTDIILNILKEKGIKATFFVTSGGPDDLIRRAYDEGHAIGLHTASHDYSVVYSSSDSYFNDLKIVSDRVEKVTGKKSMLIRFPGGSSNTISRKYSPNIMSYLTEEVLRRGYHYYDWNIDSRDAEGGRFTADEIANFVISNLSHDKVNMVLMHDTKVVTKDALAKIIDYGKNNGYEFDKIHLFTDMVVQHVNN
ncbi:MAG TPA: polysaccharide deacetylase family protein [Candidatus Faecimonas gallistercoris]|nr:polysaccharide deacetylase family protein [Candidatus Faecimonas gallistercoris]